MKKVYLAIHSSYDGIEILYGAYKIKENADKIVNQKKEEEFGFWSNMKKDLEEPVDEALFDEMYNFYVIEMDIKDY